MDAVISRFQTWSYSIAWNICLLSMGSFLTALAIKAVIIPNAFLPSGISGLALLGYYIFPVLSSGVWIFLLNIPVFLLGWFFISRRFFWYSLYGMVTLSGFIELVPWTISFHDKWLAVLAGGVVLGLGSGVSLRSLGSTGGLGILQILAREKLGIKVGQFSMGFNVVVLGVGTVWLNLNDVLYSLAMIYVSAAAIDAVQRLFNQRKLVLIITAFPDDVSGAIMTKLGRGTTLIDAKGGYTGKERTVIMTVVDSFRIKRLEATIFTIDPAAFVIIEETFSVLGKGFSVPR
ncbi:YitT family protein [Maridesulfovibrio zosterae]|uniref:YitT family protein n=1 Tax=Maridesulfovibrio zosterae TaxID=82171 RepID=UPI000684C06B|nr:YitT family protein [Maridesulfovibrio zosterae]